MKKIVFPLMVFVALLITACNEGSKNDSNQSSDPGNSNPDEMVARQIEELDEVLEFSGKQKKQMNEILTQSMNDMMDMREEMQQGGGDRESMREKMMQVREGQNKKVKDILSEEQWTKYEEFEKERRGRRGQGRQGGGQGRPE